MEALGISNEEESIKWILEQHGVGCSYSILPDRAYIRYWNNVVLVVPIQSFQYFSFKSDSRYSTF
jgi:hypothetical protein